jgi:hypothetical protein
MRFRGTVDASNTRLDPTATQTVEPQKRATPPPFTPRRMPQRLQVRFVVIGLLTTPVAAFTVPSGKN